MLAEVLVYNIECLSNFPVGVIFLPLSHKGLEVASDEMAI